MPVSAGQISEALLYYQRVHLIIDRGTLLALLRQIGARLLMTLLGRDSLTAVYCPENLGTHTESLGSLGTMKVHTYAAYEVVGHESKRLGTLQDRIEYDIRASGESKSDASRLAKKFLKLVPVRRLSGDHFLKGGIPAAARRDLQDASSVRESIRQALAAIIGGYEAETTHFRFEVVDSEIGMHVFENIDFESINRRRSQLATPLEPITNALLLAHVLDARADVALASFYGGDFITSAVTSRIVQVQHAELLRRTGLNADALRQFTEIVLPETPTLAEVIDAGERSIDDFFSLLDRASKFKQWLSGVNPDEGLVRTYLQEAASTDWIERLPSKCVRFMLSTALGATHPPAAALAGLLDSFVLDKVLAGWRPNHFVTSKLASFVGKH